ncbi:MAG TPA: TonB-dependent receptor [Candidatus Limnocylindrales bacterium]|nr:TonB-dependent receptor [Candidatus Limnocylindrales bacterium]
MSRGRTIAVAILLAAFSSTCFAQNSMTSLHGRVTDQSAAAVAGAQVTIEDRARGFKDARVTASEGEYSFPQVAPGTYAITITASGFATQTKVAELLVNLPATVDFTLSIQSVSERIDVSATVATLNTTDATIGNAVDNKEIQALPMEGRNVPDLLSLQPGVLYLGRNVDSITDSRSGTVNGARSDQSNVTLDGLDDNDQLSGRAFFGVLRSTLDSVEEFRVTTSNSNADSGRSSGAQISLITKSGTNKFHGSAYEYNRTNFGLANDWFNKQAESESGEPNTPGQLIRNTFGGTLGGPIKKDKFFFFLNYEGQRTNESSEQFRTVPTDSLKAGNVQYIDSSGNTQTLNSAQIAGMDQNCGGTGTCPWGPGNDPNALALYSGYVEPNGTIQGDGLNFESFAFSASKPVRLNTYIAKLDYNVTDRNHLFVRGNLQNDGSSGAPEFPGGIAGATTTDNSKGIAAGDTWTIGTNWVNSARYQFVRQGYSSVAGATGNFSYLSGDPPVPTGSATFTFVPVHNFVDDVSWNKGNHTIQFGINYRRIDVKSITNSTSFNAANNNWAWLSGDGIAGRDVSLDPDKFGYPTVSTAFEPSYNNAVSSLTGLLPEEFYYYNYAVAKDGQTADLIPTGDSLTRDFRDNELEYYIQDSWRLRPNLTVTFGMRQSFLQPPWEVNGQQVEPTFSAYDWYAKREADALQGNIYEPVYSYAPAGAAHNGKPYWNMAKLNIAPRLAVAYSPGFSDGILGKLFGGAGKTAIRAGYGLYYDHFGQAIAYAYNVAGSPGLLTLTQPPVNQPTVDDSPRFTSFTDVPPISATSSPVPPSGATYPFMTDPTGFAIAETADDRMKTPYSQGIDFSVQRELPGGFALEIAYVGRFGRHTLEQLDYSEPTNFVDPASHMSYFTAAKMLSQDVDALGGAPLGSNTITPIPFFENLFPGIQGSYPSVTASIYDQEWRHHRGDEMSALADLDVFCMYTPEGCGAAQTGMIWNSQYSSLFATSSIGTSSYNSAQITLRHPSTHGLQADVSYSFGHSIDLGSTAERFDIYGVQANSGAFSIIQSSYDPRQNRASSDFDTRHVITADWVYQLPFGRGKAFGNGAGRLTDAAISGWQFSGLGRWTSGLPFQVLDGSGWSTNWSYQSYMVQTGPVEQKKTIIGGNPNVFADPAAAQANMRLPYAGEAGQRNQFRGDGYFGIDAGLSKSWDTFEGQKLEFRWEVFNVTNAVRFDVQSINRYSTDLATPTPPSEAVVFGNYTAALVSPRVMQFSLRYSF